MDTTAAGPAPDAATLAQDQDKRELEGLLDGLRRRGGTDVARAAMASRGDVSRVEGYDNMYKCLAQLRSIEASAGAGSMGAGLRAATDTHAALVRHKRLFQAAFGPGGAESARYVYAGAVMGLWAVVTDLVSNAVDFVPQGSSGGLMPQVDMDGAGRVAGSPNALRLLRFADVAGRYGFEEVLGKAAQAEQEALGESFWSQGLASAGKWFGAAVLVAAVYFARDVAAWVYRTRAGWSKWLETQAAFLDMNASALDPSRRATRQKQEEYARRLRSLADRIRVDNAVATREAAADVRGEDRAYSSAPGLPGAGPQLV